MSNTAAAVAAAAALAAASVNSQQQQLRQFAHHLRTIIPEYIITKVHANCVCAESQGSKGSARRHQKCVLQCSSTANDQGANKRSAVVVVVTVSVLLHAYMRTQADFRC
eukprot:2677-Heterococcus_DN1.PRE.1